MLTSAPSLRSVTLGFVAAALSVITVHQGIVYLFASAKLLPPASVAWSLKPFGPLGIPQLVNSVFWGGLWGVLFAAVWPKLPGGAMWLRGLIFGLIVAVVSNWILVPFIKGVIFGVPKQVYFGGLVPDRMLITLTILGGFGAGLGGIFGLLHGRK
jgi:hypothetical protein